MLLTGVVARLVCKIGPPGSGRSAVGALNDTSVDVGTVLHSLPLLLRHRQATTLAWAKAYLRAVHIEMNVESTKEMMENIKCYDDLSFGAGRIDG